MDRIDSKYPQIIRAVTETPWAILPATLAAIRDLIAYRAAGYRLSDEEIRERIGAGPVSRQVSTAGTVAVLPLWGVLVPRANLMTEMSGATSVSQFAAGFRQAIGDPDVSAILLDVDSPGGMVDLVSETAATIRAARGTKPIVAISNTTAASAAYWLASQADELVVTPSGMVGGIGVLAAHDDLSGAQEKLGIQTTLISAGKFKAEGSPFEPLSAEAREAIQEWVNDFYAMFARDVALGRRASVEAVRGGFGEGRLVTARQALEQGMVDRVDTLDATLARLVHGDEAGDEDSRAESRAAAMRERLRLEHHRARR